MIATPVRVYIAGPISKGNATENVRRGCEAFSELVRLGYTPFCPFWSHLQELVRGVGADLDWAGWIAYDLQWVAFCHALLRLPGESAGADREVAHACYLGIPVFYSVDDLVRHIEPAKPG